MELLLLRDIIPEPLQRIIIFLIIITYFLPIIIQVNYSEFSFGMFAINIFLWRTPIPYLILILNIIEYNKWTERIIKKQEEINKLLEGFINSNNNDKQSDHHKQISKSS